MPKAPPASSAFPTVTRPTATSSGARTPAAGGTPPAQQDVPSFTPQAWQRTSSSAAYVYSDSEDESASSASNGDEAGDGDSLRTSKEGGEWECIACGKSGKSEGRWRDHERSKGHRRAIDRLRREMLDEDWELGLGAEQEEAARAEGNGEAAEGSDDDELSETDPEEEVLVDAVGGITLEDYEDEDSAPPSPKGTAPRLQPPANASSDDEDGDAYDQPSAKANVPGAAKKARKKKQREQREAKLAAERIAAAEAAAKAALLAAATEDDPEPLTEEASASGPGPGAEQQEAETPEMSKKVKRRERERKKAEAAAKGGGSKFAVDSTAGGAAGGPEVRLTRSTGGNASIQEHASG